MAATQNGTGGLTLGGPQTAAATYITIPSGAIIESVHLSLSGSAQHEDQYDADGAFHTSLWFEKRMHDITIVQVGIASTLSPGDMSQTNYEVMSVVPEYGKAAIRTTITLRKIKFA